MQIQKIQFNIPKFNLKQGNNITFQKKYVQPDSFINAPKKHKKIQKLCKKRPLNVSLSDIKEERSNQITEVLYKSYEDLRGAKIIGLAHKTQCLNILKKGEKNNYDYMSYGGIYNINYGYINPKTNKPSLINVWQNGRMIHQYSINSVNPLEIEVYDCEYEGLIEEYVIKDNNIVRYCAIRPEINEAELFIPNSKGFYKVEGEISRFGTYVSDSCNIKPTKAVVYNPKGISYYSEYSENGTFCYEYDKNEKIWKRISEDKTLCEFKD